MKIHNFLLLITLALIGSLADLSAAGGWRCKCKDEPVAQKLPKKGLCQFICGGEDKVELEEAWGAATEKSAESSSSDAG